MKIEKTCCDYCGKELTGLSFKSEGGFKLRNSERIITSDLSGKEFCNTECAARMLSMALRVLGAPDIATILARIQDKEAA